MKFESAFSPEAITERLNTARKICRESTDYETKCRLLEEQRLLDEQVIRVEERTSHEGELRPENNEQWMTPEDWKMLTVLELFDETTFKHSVRVYRIAREKLEQDSVFRTFFAEGLENEQVDFTDFYRACLLHDIGKTNIPLELLNYRADIDQWINQAIDYADRIGDTELKARYTETKAMTPGDREAYFMQYPDQRPIHIIPLTFLFNQETLDTFSKQTPITGDMTLAKAIEAHESESGAVLRNKSHTVAAAIAEHHHNYDHSPLSELSYPTATSGLRLSFLVEVLRTADILDALEANDRPYRTGTTHIGALGCLSLITENTEILHLWIKGEINIIDRATLSIEEQEIFDHLVGFVKE